jgi:hypothetical protein
MLRRPWAVAVFVFTGGFVCAWTIWFSSVEGLSPWKDASSSAHRSAADLALPASGIFLDHTEIVSGGLEIATEYGGTVHNTDSLAELRQALQQRGNALAALEDQFREIRLGSQRQPTLEIHLLRELASMQVYHGQLEKAAASLESVAHIRQAAGLAPTQLRFLLAMRGIIALRRGEIDNCVECVGPSTCIFPLDARAVHTNPAGSREAIQHFTAYLELAPGDLRIRWLLNLAYMTLGEYPHGVPPEYLIPLEAFESQLDIGQFENVATKVGLTARGPNLAGGSIFDDFTGDGLPDLLTTSLDIDRGASLFVNRGDGTFEDRSESAGLADQVYALNAARADFDNDGNLDVLLLRGGWESPMRMSLLRNVGGGQFEDVTLEAGLAEPIATEAAAWGDYDNDGLVDLFVCGEFLPPPPQPPFGGDPRNRCRLYRNLGHGRFVDQAPQAGLAAELCAKGAAWGDYDNDGLLDLFVSNMNGACCLFHNEGNGKFRDFAPQLDVLGPARGFACWFFDYDNDGRLDLYVNDYNSSLAEIVAFAMGQPIKEVSRPRLYRNLGPVGFRDVSQQLGLDRPMVPMGCNFGDIDNDGYLDIYLGTGRMFLEQLVPNLMFKNMAGQGFKDITASSRTGHLQKGHGVSFADWDNDGDLDLFVEHGGAVPGDAAHNALFNNPGHRRHWLKVKLIGRQMNRAALGAKIHALVEDQAGNRRSIYRTVGNNSSFGGNSLVELIGLGDATQVAELNITWPASATTQTFGNVSADQAIEITEGVDPFATVSLPRRNGSTRQQ